MEVDLFDRGSEIRNAQAADDARDGITHVVRAAARRTPSSTPSCSTRSARRGRATRTARSSSTRVRPAGVLLRLARSSPSMRRHRRPAPQAAGSSRAVRGGGDRRRVTKRRLHAARRLRLPRGARRPGAAIEWWPRLTCEFRARGPVGAVDLDRKQLDERDAAVAFTSKLGAAQLASARATFRKRVARGVG